MAEYTLMNKNHPVVSFRYDRDIHAVVKIVDVHDLRYAPVALADSKGIVTRRALNDWWRRRAIPASRHQIQQLLDSLNLNSTLSWRRRILDFRCLIVTGSTTVRIL